MKIIKLLKALSFALLIIFSTQVFAESYSNPLSFFKDTFITTYMKGKISSNKNIPSSNINISTTNGVVTITGKVDSDTQAGALVVMAKSIPMVKKIDISKLNIKESKQPLSDTAITGVVKSALFIAPLFKKSHLEAMRIHVETNNGVVYLSGSVDTQAEIDDAIKIAESAQGVIRVESTLKIVKSSDSSY